ncbi:MAG: 50S ribosomal protein L24 [Thermomonas sp.]
MNRIKKGDQVVVTTGNKKIKGQTGEVLRVDGERVYVSNLNLVKRATKPNPQAGQPGGLIEREASIHISNVMPLNPVTGKGERVATKVLENGKRIRLFRSSGEAI